MNTKTSPNHVVEKLIQRIEILEGEADIRRIQARYMFLCDTPCPESGLLRASDRIDAIVDLYSDDAVWEGVGSYYENQFGRATGKAEIRQHFERFWSSKNRPDLTMNVHYLTSEQIHVEPNARSANGQWIHLQPWLFSDGTGLVRSSRLNNVFRKDDDGRWLITRTRTENVFVANLPGAAFSDVSSHSVLMS